MEALQHKYNQQKAPMEDMHLTAKIEVQLVGTEKLQRQRGGIDKLREVALLDARISSMVSSS